MKTPENKHCEYSNLASPEAYLLNDINYFNTNDLLQLEDKYKTTLINSVGGFKSCVLIGTKSKLGKTNLAIFSSIVHLGANPSLIGFIMRPKPEERHTLGNLLENPVFTINHINESIYINAHQTSARYPSNISEFDATKLSEEYLFNLESPFVKESHIKLGAKFIDVIEIPINGTRMIIAEITHIVCPTACISPDGFIDIEKANTVTCSGLDSYHTTQKINRLTYAKPNTWPEIIK